MTIDLVLVYREKVSCYQILTKLFSGNFCTGSGVGDGTGLDRNRGVVDTTGTELLGEGIMLLTNSTSDSINSNGAQFNLCKQHPMRTRKMFMLIRDIILTELSVIISV